MLKRIFAMLLIFTLLLSGCGAKPMQDTPCVAAATKPVAVFAAALLQGTGVRVETVVSESVSCLHDYSLSVRQMELIASADAVLLSGAGLEAFMGDALAAAKTVVDASYGIETRQENGETDPHIWLDPQRAKQMAANLAAELSVLYPANAQAIEKNLAALSVQLDELTEYGTAALSALPKKALVTFHDGFAYFAEAFGLSVLASIEEEAGSEIAAADLEKIIALVRENGVSAVFTEENGMDNAAKLVAAETGAQCFTLDTGLGDTEYFAAMRHNIDTVREALS